jgi:hypothetical protein
LDQIDLSEDGEPVITEKECPEDGCRPDSAYDPKTYLDSTEAVEIALRAGGRSFLLERSEADYGLPIGLSSAYDPQLV